MKPLQFQAILKPTLWGGDGVVRLKGLDDQLLRIGESWEISGLPGNETPVLYGDAKGLTLKELIGRYGEELTGHENLRRYGTDFPLLIKFISAGDDLSLQVHPDDNMAQRMGHPFGKSEMWYIVQTEKDAVIRSGFSHPFSPEEYRKALAAGNLTDYVVSHPSEAGCCFYIPAGRIHSIGKGNLLIEIQQSSNDTFRAYDFNRRDTKGNLRELHVEQACEALDYEWRDARPVSYRNQEEGISELLSTPEFTVRKIAVRSQLGIDYSDIDSFVVYIGISGQAQLTDSEGNKVTLKAGESLLLPAANSNVALQTAGDIPFECLETYIV